MNRSHRRLSRYFVVALYASLIYLSALPPVVQAIAASFPLAAGMWIVQGRALPGHRRCGNWQVRLTSRQGKLSGVVALARASVPIHNLTVLPDGSFSGATRGGVAGSGLARAYRVSGQFAGNTVSVTLKDNVCPARQGTANRQAFSG